MSNKLPEIRPLHITTSTPNLAFRPAHTIHYCHRHPERRSSPRSSLRPETTTFFLSNHPQWRQSGLRVLWDSQGLQEARELVAVRALLLVLAIHAALCRAACSCMCTALYRYTYNYMSHVHGLANVIHNTQHLLS